MVLPKYPDRKHCRWGNKFIRMLEAEARTYPELYHDTERTVGGPMTAKAFSISNRSTKDFPCLYATSVPVRHSPSDSMLAAADPLV